MDVIELAKQLIEKPSITPEDAGCQMLLKKKLAALGFQITDLPFEDVTNFFAIKGNAEPVLVFAGHTDVVPPGPLKNWTSDPFTPSIRNGKLYGRGAADMKSSLAAMVCACEKFLAEHSNHCLSIAFIITSDEEGPSINGTKKVVEYLQQHNQSLNYCIVGEASSVAVLGDTIKIGRRGSLSGHLILKGKQGHVAYPQLADNPIHRAGNIINLLNKQIWDKGNQHFPATSFQLSNIHAGTGANNVIPEHCELDFNFRYAPVSSVISLQDQVHKILKSAQAEYDIIWHHSAEPFYTEDKAFIDTVSHAIQKVTDTPPQATTTGGTSDGRFIAPTGCSVVEVGPINASIHQIDEHIIIDDLKQLSEIYYQIIHDLN